MRVRAAALAFALSAVFLPSLGLACPDAPETLAPFSAERVARALNRIRVPGPHGWDLVVRVSLIEKSGSPESRRRDITYEVYEEGNPLPIGGGSRLVDPDAFPLVYPATAIIRLEEGYQGSGIGTAVLKALHEAAPIGARFEFMSTNKPTNGVLDHWVRQHKSELGDHPLPGEVEAVLNRRLNRAFATNDELPLWAHILRKAGWRNIRVEVSDFSAAWTYSFAATK